MTRLRFPGKAQLLETDSTELRYSGVFARFGGFSPLQQDFQPVMAKQMNDVQIQLDYAEAIADWFLDLSEAALGRRDLETALRYTHVAANIYARQNRTLSSARIETNLQQIGRLLVPPRSDTAERESQGERGACLHVVTEALPLGGVTSMITRWIENDRSGCAHHVATLAQELEIPEPLRRAAHATGGMVHTIDPNELFINRARWLRALSQNLASNVVLHIDVSDVIAGAAFGSSGGPPVLLVNHAAHTFWTGASVTDLIVNCRGSALEKMWAENYRITPRHTAIPIPLPEHSENPLPKADAKARLGLPKTSVVLLTVGASFKYLPANRLDFLAASERILRKLPDAFLLVVGFAEDDRWREAAGRVDGRIRLLGTLAPAQLGEIRQAADIYIEGFPFGTTTALLEAGLAGLPVVLAPASAPPPFGTDGVALDDVVERPRSVAEYEQVVVRLAKDETARARAGDIVSRSIAEHHTDGGWQRYLESAREKLPAEHRVYAPATSPQTEPSVHEYWSNFVTVWSWPPAETLENSVLHAYTMGLRPRLTHRVVNAGRRYRSVRKGRSVPLPLLISLCNIVAPAVPPRWAGGLFRVTAFLFRGALFARSRRYIAQQWRREHRRGSAYREYFTEPAERDLFPGQDFAAVKRRRPRSPSTEYAERN